MTIQIEEGKTYSLRDGRTGTAAPHWNELYPWMIAGNSFTKDGRFYNDQTDSQFDVVAEVPAPVSDQHAAETVEGKPDVEDDGFITRDTPEWAAAVEAEASEEIAPQRELRVGDKVEHKTVKDVGYGEVLGLVGNNHARVNLSKKYGICTDPINVLTLVEPAKREPVTKAKMLDAAKAAVADRGLNYGTPEDNFKRICALWNKHLENRGVLVPGAGQRCLDTADVALMMVLLKVARLENQPNHMDSWTDIAGYAACGAELMDSI